MISCCRRARIQRSSSDWGPGAGEQRELGARWGGVPCVEPSGVTDAGPLCQQALRQARSGGRDVVILDTAGRLHVDDELMEELARIKSLVRPQEVLLVLDAMTGQDAVNSARAFASRVGLSGVILTKLEGDARGGAALSVRAVTGCPVKFVGLGETVEALEPFHPDRMAARILGRGDVLTLVEKVQAEVGEAEARALERKLRAREFTLEDFKEQLKRMEKMGPLDQLLSLLPGMDRARRRGAEVDPRQLRRVLAIIDSMTPEERRDPSIVGGSRRRRIAAGSGTTVQDVNRLLRQFEEARRLFRHLAGAGRRGPGGPGDPLAPLAGA
ncbi:MAG: hypothetical protein K6T75_11250 [Acetobacteraceae bacterium]|nr:hypothetical protein [Acetobacteraceae bacterium]